MKSGTRCRTLKSLLKVLVGGKLHPKLRKLLAQRKPRTKEKKLYKLWYAMLELGKPLCSEDLRC